MPGDACWSTWMTVMADAGSGGKNCYFPGWFVQLETPEAFWPWPSEYAQLLCIGLQKITNNPKYK